MVSLKTQIAGFSFDNCLMNAAGVSCMTVEELEAVRQSSAGTFITKTATLTPRQGNPEPRYRDVPLGSINSMGLPNQGIELLSGLPAYPSRVSAGTDIFPITGRSVARRNTYPAGKGAKQRIQRHYRTQPILPKRPRQAANRL